MIVERTNELRQQLQEYGRLKQNDSQLVSIQNTADELSNLQRQVKAWTEVYPFLQPYFSTQQQYKFSRQAMEIQLKLAECKLRFQIHRYPQELLKQLQRLCSTLTDSTEQAWQQYARNHLSPVQEIIKAARQLPKMQSKLAQVDSILTGLVGQSQKLPKRSSDVQRFHEQINAIKSKLQEVETMNVQQKAFLEKVYQGTATLADLDDNLLEWCKQQGLAAQLKLVSKV